MKAAIRATCLLLAWTTANVEASVEQCRDLERADRAAAAACYRALLRDPSFLVRAEAAWALDDFFVANDYFRAAAAAAPDDPDILVRWGEMYAAAHLPADAETLFQEALALDPQHVEARMGLAQVAFGRFDARAETLAREVLDIEPEHRGAQLLLARLALEAGDMERAHQELAGPLAAADIRPRLDAMSLAAAMDHLAGKAPSPWEERALELHPGYGKLFETVAHFYIVTRRYRQAVSQLERAIAIDPRLWSAYATLGINLLRLNRFAEARLILTRAYGGDRYNVETVNTLRLLDSLDRWQTRTEEGLLLRTDPAETAALAPYVRELVADGLRIIGKRYGFMLAEPVAVELYPLHEDFAVRTSGLPGIGILGATFGPVVAMNSPSARGVDEGFDWASVLWHEIAHVVTLGATDNRVSRWFSEGVSVLEEWQTGPSRFRADDDPATRRAAAASPGHDDPTGRQAAPASPRQDDPEDGGDVAAPPPRRAVPLAVVEAHREGRLLPVADLDEGFIRPRYPGQVAVSYVQAGLICEHLAAAHGFEALARMLAAYAQGADTASAIRTALAMEPEALDGAFASYLSERFQGIDAAAFHAALAQTRDALATRNWTAAMDAAQRAIAAYPYAIDPPSPYPILAQAQHRLGDRAGAIDTLTTYWRAGGRMIAPLAQLADWLESAHRADEALAVRRALALVAPLDGEHRVRLGDRLLAAGRADEALAEYLAYQSLDPYDAAAAHYRLARAYHSLGDTEAARRQVVLALEIAPSFDAALDLLVEINQ